METITINTGLQNFLLIDRIADVGDRNICGFKHFSKAPAFHGIEALAQLGALHARYATNFEMHAFLLKISSTTIQYYYNLDGFFQLSGILESNSTKAFNYQLTAYSNGKVIIEGKFIFALSEYNNAFKKEMLQNHYKKVFSCLQNDS